MAHEGVSGQIIQFVWLLDLLECCKDHLLGFRELNQTLPPIPRRVYPVQHGDALQTKNGLDGYGNLHLSARTTREDVKNKTGECSKWLRPPGCYGYFCIARTHVAQNEVIWRNRELQCAGSELWIQEFVAEKYPERFARWVYLHFALSWDWQPIQPMVWTCAPGLYHVVPWFTCPECSSVQHLDPYPHLSILVLTFAQTAICLT